MMARRIFLSCDIEGTCGIANWNEADRNKPDYAAFAAQMTREVAAACEGALAGGAEELLVRDAHDSARNIDVSKLPEAARVFRGWGFEPYGMMSGLDGSYSGAIFTGYHSAAGWSGNPLSHTMNTQNVYVRVNGEDASELMINAISASMLGVPSLMVTGDRMLCEWFRTKVPGAVAVPVNEGVGGGAITMHPDKAVRLIREAAEKAMSLNPAACLYPMPERFAAEICYREHFRARGASWYPGAVQVDSRTVRYESDQWMDVLTFFHFCL